MKICTKTTRHARGHGFTLFEAILVTFILAVLIALWLPRWTRRSRPSATIGCLNRLKQVGLAFRSWAMDNGDKFPMEVPVTNGGTRELLGSALVAPHFQVLSNELGTPRILICPSDKRRTWPVSFETNFTDANLSYFIGPDATQTNTTKFLCGDDNLSSNGVPLKTGLVALGTNSPIAWTSQRHSNQGNILWADGSVQTFSSGQLRSAFVSMGVATNRLLMP